MKVGAQSYKLFYKVFQNEIEQYSKAFSGVDEYVFEAVDFIMQEKLDLVNRVKSKINPEIEYYINNKEDGAIILSPLKIVFSKGAHLKSFKNLPNYNKKQEIVFEFNYMDENILRVEHNYNYPRKFNFQFASIKQIDKDRLVQEMNYNVELKELYTSFIYDTFKSKNNLRYGLSGIKKRYYDNFRDKLSKPKEIKEKKFYKSKDDIAGWINSHIDNSEKEEQKREEERAKRKTKREQEKKNGNQKNNNLNTDPNNYYKLLNVPYNATVKEIKKAYREKVNTTHPDKNEEESSTKKTIILNRAMETLKDPIKRNDYNRKKGINVEVDMNDRGRD